LEVQRCQALGTRFLLGIKADGLEAVGGNANFGDPGIVEEPFGSYFSASGGISENKKMKVVVRRQVDVNTTPSYPPFPILNISDSVPAPVFTPSASVTVIVSSETVAALSSTDTSTFIVKPTPVKPASTAAFPNLFDESHPPSAFALTLFSLFGEGHTERADLRPLGPDVGSLASPPPLNGTDWVTPPTSDQSMVNRPLGEEVVIDGYDVSVPIQWQGTYQEDQFQALVSRLGELTRDSWTESGGIDGGPGDLGADGQSGAYFGWSGEMLKARGAGVTVKGPGWIEWDGGA
jgi:hypothetical protein